MLKKEITCFECGYCGLKFDNEEECARHEAKHAEEFRSEKNLFDKFVSELADISIKKNEAATGLDTEVPQVYCSKCMKAIGEDQEYLTAFGYTLCLGCSVPMMKSFARNFANFKSQFLTYMNMVNPYHSRFTVDDKGNIIEERCKRMIIDHHDHHHDCECDHESDNVCHHVH